MNAFNSLKPKAGAKPAPKAATKPAQATKQAEPAKRPSRAVSDFQVAFDALPKQRASASKYAPLMARWPVGAAVRCTAKEANSIAQALRKHLQRSGQSGRAHICAQYPGDTSSTPARVWWLAE